MDYVSGEFFRYDNPTYWVLTDYPGSIETKAISPLFQDLRGFPPTFIQVGSVEVSLSDSTRLAEALRQAGTEVTLKVWDGMEHAWQMYEDFEDEAELANEEAGKWVQQHVPYAEVKKGKKKDDDCGVIM